MSEIFNTMLSGEISGTISHWESALGYLQKMLWCIYRHDGFSSMGITSFKY